MEGRWEERKLWKKVNFFIGILREVKETWMSTLLKYVFLSNQKENEIIYIYWRGMYILFSLFYTKQFYKLMSFFSSLKQSYYEFSWMWIIGEKKIYFQWSRRQRKQNP